MTRVRPVLVTLGRLYVRYHDWKARCPRCDTLRERTWYGEWKCKNPHCGISKNRHRDQEADT